MLDVPSIMTKPGKQEEGGSKIILQRVEENFGFCRTVTQLSNIPGVHQEFSKIFLPHLEGIKKSCDVNVSLKFNVFKMEINIYSSPHLYRRESEKFIVFTGV